MWGLQASLSKFEYIFRGIYIFSHSIFSQKIGFHLSVKLNEMVRVAADLASRVTLALSNEFCIVLFFCGYMFVCEEHCVIEKGNGVKFAFLVHLYSVYCSHSIFLIADISLRASVKSCN